MLHAVRIAFALLLCAGSARAGEALDRICVRVECESGRAVFVERGMEPTVLKPGREWELCDTAHVEVGAQAAVRIAWPGRASLRVHGPATLQWVVDSDARGEAVLEWTLFDVRSAELEVRAESLRIFLPGNWTGRFERGIYRIQSLTTGGVEVETRAGMPVWIGARGPDGATRPTARVDLGQRVRLEGRAVLPPPRRGARAHAWSAMSWPFGPAERERDGECIVWPATLGAPPTTATEAVHAPELQTPTAPTTEAPALAPPSPSATEFDGGALLAAIEASQAPADTTAPSSASALPPPALASAPITPSSALVWVDNPLAERALKLEPSSAGGTRISVGAEEAAPVRVHAPRFDLLLAPGAWVELEASGEVRDQDLGVQLLPRTTSLFGSTPRATRVAGTWIEPPQAASMPFDPALWREVGEHELRIVGGLACATSTRAELDLLQNGRTSCNWPADRAESLWIMSSARDYQLAPGSMVLVGSDGRLEASVGTVRVEPAPAGRKAAFEFLQRSSNAP